VRGSAGVRARVLGGVFGQAGVRSLRGHAAEATRAPGAAC
jgi:hypothetical protein